MTKRFEIIFEKSGAQVVADLFEDKAPITCENFWEAIEKPLHGNIHHGAETGPEMYCLLPAPKEEIPYENSTVFPEHGDILYYHYIQPPTRDGIKIFDIGIYWDRGQSKLLQGWIAGNHFAKVNGKEQIKILRQEAGRLLSDGKATVILRRKEN